MVINDKAKRDSLLNSTLYKDYVRKKIGNMPSYVKDEIDAHSLHILGRCNNPADWRENKQGLVFGMVQSGKTASMVSLIGLAIKSGYRLFIVLSGDKDSLRDQTQKRINDAFGLAGNGSNVKGFSKIIN